MQLELAADLASITSFVVVPAAGMATDLRSTAVGPVRDRIGARADRLVAVSTLARRVRSLFAPKCILSMRGRLTASGGQARSRVALWT